MPSPGPWASWRSCSYSPNGVRGCAIPGAWILRVETLDAAGNAGPVPAPTACTSPTGTIADCDAAINALGLTQRATYQPPQRYERFQLTELTLYLLLAIAVSALGAWRVRRMDLT
jgi:hypothetical protein